MYTLDDYYYKNQEPTDKWRGYKLISKAYDAIQIESNRELNLKTPHTWIRQVKSWIRFPFYWISDDNLTRYFNEFCFGINRSQNKAAIFNDVIFKVMEGDQLYQSELMSNYWPPNYYLSK